MLDWYKNCANIRSLGIKSKTYVFKTDANFRLNIQ